MYRFVAIGMMALASACQAAKYSVIDLGQPSNTTAFPYGINNSGVVVGQMQDAGGNPLGFRWENGVFTTLSTLGGLYSTAFDINNAGTIIGFGYAPDNTYHRVTWTGPANTIHDLGTLTGGLYGEAYKINENGIITGQGTIGNGDTHGWIYQNGGFTDIGTLGGTYIEPRAINDAGIVAGWSYLSGMSGPKMAFLFMNNQMSPLGTLGGNSFATQINNSNVIVGMSEISPGGPRHAFRMTVGGQMQDLGAGPWVETRADDVNQVGVIVGWAYDANGKQLGVLLDPGGWQDLNALIDPNSGWFIREGSQINDLGQIAARGVINGVERAVLLTPMPEPAPAALLAGGIGLFLLRRRQSR